AREQNDAHPNRERNSSCAQKHAGAVSPFCPRGASGRYFASGKASGFAGGAVWLSMLMEQSDPHIEQTLESAASLSILYRRAFSGSTARRNIPSQSRSFR